MSIWQLLVVNDEIRSLIVRQGRMSPGGQVAVFGLIGSGRTILGRRVLRFPTLGARARHVAGQIVPAHLAPA